MSACVGERSCLRVTATDVSEFDSNSRAARAPTGSQTAGRKATNMCGTCTSSGSNPRSTPPSPHILVLHTIHPLACSTTSILLHAPHHPSFLHVPDHPSSSMASFSAVDAGCCVLQVCMGGASLPTAENDVECESCGPGRCQTPFLLGPCLYWSTPIQTCDGPRHVLVQHHKTLEPHTISVSRRRMLPALA